MIRCAHGDTATYPLAWVELTIDGVLVKVEAALSDTLPSPVLLGRDVPELPSLLNQGRGLAETRRRDDAMVVTRVGAQRTPTTMEEHQGTKETDRIQQELRLMEAETLTETQLEQEEVQPESDTPDPELLGSTFDSELFQLDDVEGPQQRRLTRAQKRAGRWNYKQEQLKTVGNNEEVLEDGLDLSAREVKELQDSDETLAELRRMAEKGDP